MKNLRDISATLIVIVSTWAMGAIWGCSRDKILTCDSVNVIMAGWFMAVVILVFFCFIAAILMDKRN